MNDHDTTGATPAEIITPTVAEAQSRAEYDISIATARRYPRSYATFLNRAESLATATPEIAAAMEYAKPVGKDKVRGPSTRLAEIVASTFGNLRVQARVIAETATEIIAQGVAHDLESNTAQSTEVAVSILKRDGTRYGADQVATMRAAACSKARRNAIFLVVPLALIQPVIAAARKVAVGDAKTLPERRKATLDWFESKGAKRAVVFAWLGVKAEADITLEHMADLIAARNTATEEGTSMAELFAHHDADGKASANRFAGAAPQQQTATAGAPAQQQPAAESPKGNA